MIKNLKYNSGSQFRGAEGGGGVLGSSTMEGAGSIKNFLEYALMLLIRQISDKLLLLKLCLPQPYSQFLQNVVEMRSFQSLRNLHKVR